MATFGFGQPTKIGPFTLIGSNGLRGTFVSRGCGAVSSGGGRLIERRRCHRLAAVGRRTMRPARWPALGLSAGAGSSSGSCASLGGGSLGGKAGGCWNSSTGGFVTAAGSSAGDRLRFGSARLRVGLFARRRATRRRHQYDGKDAGRQRPSKTKNVHGYILYRKTFLVIPTAAKDSAAGSALRVLRTNACPRFRHGLETRAALVGRGWRTGSSHRRRARRPLDSTGAFWIRKVAMPMPSPMPKRIVSRIARIVFIGGMSSSCMSSETDVVYRNCIRTCHGKMQWHLVV